jgi:polysaccharide export outer membrane protein
MRSAFAALLFILSTVGLAGQSAGALSDGDARYRLQPNDVIDILYRFTPEFNQTATVEPDGFASLQLIGGVKLGGLTLDQAHAAIFERASARLRTPQVSVLLKDYDKPHFVVSGEVRAPGRFDLRGRTTAVEAIAMAGGIVSASAKHSQVILIRRIAADEGETRILNIKRMMQAPQSAEDVTLRPGDMLIVPQNKVSKIERFVKWGNFGLYANPIP